MKKRFNLNVFRACLAQYEIELQTYVDRVKFYVDSMTTQDHLNRLKDLTTAQHIKLGTLPHHSTFWLHVDARQPNPSYFQELKNTIRGDYGVNYIELALDGVVKTKRQRNALRRFLDEHVIFARPRKSPRFYHENYKGTFYYGARAEHDAKVLVVYSDKPSKQALQKQCVHLEIRVSGLEAVKACGLVTFRNLVELDHEAFWEEHLDLRRPEYAKAGELLGSAAASPQGQIKKAHAYLARYDSLQAVLSHYPELEHAFKPLTRKRELNDRLRRYNL